MTQEMNQLSAGLVVPFHCLEVEVLVVAGAGFNQRPDG